MRCWWRLRVMSCFSASSINTSRHIVVVFRHHVFGVLSSSHRRVVSSRCRVVVLTLFFVCRVGVVMWSCCGVVLSSCRPEQVCLQRTVRGWTMLGTTQSAISQLEYGGRCAKNHQTKLKPFETMFSHCYFSAGKARG